MLHHAIIVKNSGIQGKGLFASADIKAGEIIWRRDPDEVRFHVDVIRSWPAEKQEKFGRYAYQVGEEWYHGPEDGIVTDPADYMNHSCDPNTWFIDDANMVARRDIKKGEEITYDYATSETAENFVLICNCGAPNCRKVVRGSDYRMNKSVREQYGEHVMRHVFNGALKYCNEERDR
ncbi:MAG: SET domain-containing protein-lysine N-methyltransferase [candidate division KSB1 bacterium]|nr:SET domain-containing protein-lysine N-methyltransferase [candidate division KSB1 bacterium]MDZ7301773.1 SET domain-containing protein-lysine N-methyltransferase [candidate division KSB1 bacterium]MDZ7311448.1 SET domain-containing protein-lysine N-methyltransferase [candidate division KSB1 bacterium]